MTRENLIETLILQALREHPEGLTEKEIYKEVKRKEKKLKKLIDIIVK